MAATAQGGFRRALNGAASPADDLDIAVARQRSVLQTDL
jgi:hypothetical protein